MNFKDQIKSKENNDYLQGIEDEHGIKEIKANSMGKQIFELYDYYPRQIENNHDLIFLKENIHDLRNNYTERELNRYLFKEYGHRNLKSFLNDDDSYFREPERTDYGIDDVIYISKIPYNDPLNLKALKKGRFDDTCYTVDYKSNNFRNELEVNFNSVYVKLMPFKNKYDYILHERDGKLVNPIHRNIERSKKIQKRGHSYSYDPIDVYRNKQLLGINNRTDYFLYMKFEDHGEELPFRLNHAYLVPAEPLRIQVIDILNTIRESSGHDQSFLKDPIFLRKKTIYLNPKIYQALIGYEDSVFNENEIELFMHGRNKKEITLKIHETKLTPHIKFDKCGNIIYNQYI